MEFIEILKERPEKPKRTRDTPVMKIIKEINNTDAKYIKIDFKKVEDYYRTPQSLARVLGRLLIDAQVFADENSVYVIRE